MLNRKSTKGPNLSREPHKPSVFFHTKVCNPDVSLPEEVKGPSLEKVEKDIHKVG
jgi:hypothetical protein